MYSALYRYSVPIGKAANIGMGAGRAFCPAPLIKGGPKPLVNTGSKAGSVNRDNSFKLTFAGPLS